MESYVANPSISEPRKTFLVSVQKMPEAEQKKKNDYINHNQLYQFKIAFVYLV